MLMHTLVGFYSTQKQKTVAFTLKDLESSLDPKLILVKIIQTRWILLSRYQN